VISCLLTVTDPICSQPWLKASLDFVLLTFSYMSKIIYSLKIYIFRSQFWLTAHKISSLRQFHMFVIKVYLKAWFTCLCASSAPQNDLQLLCELQSYKKHQKSVAEAAIKSFSGHLWYCSITAGEVSHGKRARWFLTCIELDGCVSAIV